MCREAAVSLVEPYGIEMNSLGAEGITYFSKFQFDFQLGASATSLAFYLPKHLETVAELVETFNVIPCT